MVAGTRLSSVYKALPGFLILNLGPVKSVVPLGGELLIHQIRSSLPLKLQTKILVALYFYTRFLGKRYQFPEKSS